MSEPKPLCQFIEKIIETGTMTQEDQNEITRLAYLKPFSEKDSAAVQRLTDFITEGRVSVAD